MRYRRPLTGEYMTLTVKSKKRILIELIEEYTTPAVKIKTDYGYKSHLEIHATRSKI
jgi:hypothetical protein